MAKRKPQLGHLELDVHVAVLVLLQHFVGLDSSVDSVRLLRNDRWSCECEEQEGKRAQRDLMMEKSLDSDWAS
jgi:hypothetical protein